MSEITTPSEKSILNRNWKLRPQYPDLNIVQNILRNRGIENQDEINSYLNPSYKKGFHNPFLLKDMEKAVERLRQATANQERVIIFGDYDVDGISGTAILYQALQIYGANISYRLPHRVNDGYGLNIKFIDEFIEKGVKVLITVDCGISCYDQIAKAAEAGIDVIITDHHTIPAKIPDHAHAILHPKQSDCAYPFKGLTGAGVAYKLASALLTDKLSGEEREKHLFSLLDLASLGTVADLGPLVDENRIIVKYGLETMQKSNWPGLSLLMESAGIDLSQKLGVSDIGFKIGPRINAAGRIDHPYYALQMLLHDGDIHEGRQKAAYLEKLNQERQQMVIKALEEAELKYAEKPADQKIFVAWSPDWHVGILGLICSKIVEKYNMPAIILQEFDDHLVASFRSTESLNAVDALNHTKDLLSHYGGHAQAAGFSLKKENIHAFVEKVAAYAADELEHHNFEHEMNIDAEINHQDINEEFMRLLALMEPHGVGNERPTFLVKGIKAEDIKTVGKESNHLHFLARTGQGKFSCIAFKLGKHRDLIMENPLLDLVIHLDKNVWNGRENIQFQVLDIRPVNLPSNS
ncbi:single-stranded-DNA-specific exonuclease RecJ [Candidatus Peregrinibacteria bacterium]|nr:single-stranded-DNA-specific exonuclease RecJ [Candidatus Peregrinibacteria bacterium]